MEKRNIRFITTRFTLPLFMLTRRSLQKNNLEHLRKYLMKKSNFLAQLCKNENMKENATKTLNHFKHVVGFEEHKPHGPCLVKMKLRKIPTEIIARRKRQSSKIRSHKKQPKKYVIGRQLVSKAKRKTSAATDTVNIKGNCFYSLPNVTHCNKYKAAMLGNARLRKPSQRMMVADLTSCYKEPHEPTPTTYDPKYIKEPFSVPKLYPSTPNPHVFGKESVVPVKDNAVHMANTSSMPGPGRYDPFYPTSCPCPRKRKLKLGLRLFIDQQKRLKFRRLPYVKIKIKQYCDREWDHVKGHGFQHLFTKDKLTQRVSTKRIERKGRKRDDLVNLNAINYKYIQIINNPQRKVFSFRLQPIPCKAPVIKFTSLEKYVIRKQLRFNKKIAFGTGRDRFPDMPGPMPMTSTKLQKIKHQIPAERRFTSKPIMEKSPSCILSKYMEPVKPRYPMLDLSLRKRDFRFMPLPEAKLLMSSDEILINAGMKTGFYHKQLAPQDYFNRQDIFEQNFNEISTRRTV